jgi:hypothetical protein
LRRHSFTAHAAAILKAGRQAGRFMPKPGIAREINLPDRSWRIRPGLCGAGAKGKQGRNQ